MQRGRSTTVHALTSTHTLTQEPPYRGHDHIDEFVFGRELALAKAAPADPSEYDGDGYTPDCFHKDHPARSFNASGEEVDARNWSRSFD